VPQVQANGIYLEYESFGATRDPAAVLIMGLGAQLTRWTIPFCEKLVGRGYRVIRFDNRDVGRSTHLHDARVPSLGQILGANMAGTRIDVPYTLDDMAADTVGLLDALHIDKAHIVGASMGGMIAQLIAADYPQRTLSLTSIMSTSGNPSLPPPTPAAAAVLMTRSPDPAHREAYLSHGLAGLRTLSSPAYPFDADATRERLLTDLGRGYNPAGYARQMAAVGASGDRRAKLRTVAVPAVVVHGADDPLVPVAAGRDTAQSIPNAELRIVPGMGHDLPVALYDAIVDAIDGVARKATGDGRQATARQSLPNP
jgi:pimeloyl-ACP methyl ester carboxylesterase